MIVIKPEATFYSDLGEPLAAAEVILSAGFGIYPNASIVLHPQQDSGIDPLTYAKVIKKLQTMSKDSKRLLKGQIKLKTTDTSSGDSSEISLNGLIKKPGYTTAYGAEPNFSLDIIHEVSMVSSFDTSIYKLTPNVLSASPSIKNIAVPKTFLTTDSMGQAALNLLTALFKSYSASGFALSRKVKAAIHARNTELLPWVTNIIQRLDDNGPNWKALLQGNDQYNLVYQMYTALTNRSRDYTSNLTSLFYMFGMVWYSIFDVEETGDYIKALSYAKLKEGDGGKADLEYAPAALSYTTPVYLTSSGLPPTNVVVEAAARPSVLDVMYSPSNLVACYPPPGEAGDNPLYYKTNAPLWLPDGVAITPIKYVEGGTMTPASIGPTVKKMEKVTTKTNTTLQTICEKWAELTYYEKTLLPEVAELTIPMDLSIEPGTLCIASTKGGEASFTGLIWKVTHKLVVNNSAVTQLLLRPIILN